MKNGLSIACLLVPFFLSGIYVNSFGQFENKITSNSESEKTINALIEKANYFLDSDLDSAIYYGEKAYRLLGPNNYSNSSYLGSKVHADAWYYKDSLSRSIEYYRMSADIIKELEGINSEKYAARISDVGYCFYSLNIFDIAVSYYMEALNIFKSTNNVEEISNQLNNIGTVYFSWGNFNMAIEHFSQTLRYDKERGDSIAMSTSYNNIGKVYEAWGYYDLAIEHYQKSLNFLGNKGDEARKAIRLSNIGTSYFRKNDYDKGLEYLYEALKIDRSLNNRFKLAIRQNEIANIFSAKNDYTKAIEQYLLPHLSGKYMGRRL